MPRLRFTLRALLAAMVGSSPDDPQYVITWRHRPRQFSLKTMLWLTVVVSAFFAGIRFEQDRRNEVETAGAPVSATLVAPTHVYYGGAPLRQIHPSYSHRLFSTGR